jgi:hypothetical protein
VEIAKLSDPCGVTMIECLKVGSVATHVDMWPSCAFRGWVRGSRGGWVRVRLGRA